MGMEKGNPRVAHDHSNPQQGIGAMKAKVQIDYDSSKNTNELSQSDLVEDKRKIFVGGLPTDITQLEFRSFFSQFGELREALVMFDRNTGRSRGFGFVTYVDQEISKSLLQMGNNGDGVGRLNMRGKICEIKAAVKKTSSTRVSNHMVTDNRSRLKEINQIPPVVYSEHVVPPMNHNIAHCPMPYPPYVQGGYNAAPFVSGHGTPMHLPFMYDQHPHRIPVSEAYDFRSGGTTEAPLFYTSPPMGYFAPQHGFGYIPLPPGHVLPHSQAPYLMQSVELGSPLTEEKNDKK